MVLLGGCHGIHYVMIAYPQISPARKKLSNV